jgi:CheY-like chemotaxis protein
MIRRFSQGTPNDEFPSPDNRERGPRRFESASKGNILIVEDDQVSASALRTILKRLGWDVVEALTVAEGLVSLNQPLNAIILDLMLPDGDGAVVLDRVRRVNPKCRVAVTTGVSDPERLKKLKAQGPDLVWMKPIDLQALVRFLEAEGDN